MNREITELVESMKEVSGDLVTNRDTCQHANVNVTRYALYDVYVCVDCGKTWKSDVMP